MEEHGLPQEVQRITGQRACPLGDAALQLNDAVLAAETCEELFTPAAPHIALALSGVEIITNGSGSHHQVAATTTCCCTGAPLMGASEALRGADSGKGWHSCGSCTSAWT